MNQIRPTVDMPLVHPTYVRMLCATLRRHGVDVDAALQTADVPPWSVMATSEQLLDQRTIDRLIAVRYNARRLAFRLDDATLTQPGMTADPTAYAQACQQCEHLAAQAASVSLAQRVTELLAHSEGQYPTLTEVAGTFHVSPRTLIRRLKQEGSRYQTLLDTSRQPRALWYLCHTHHTVEDIAARLGYTGTTNFSRTFRRWFGRAPGDVRRECQAC